MSAPDQKAWKATRDEMEEIHGIMECQGKGRGLDYDLLWPEARRIANAVASRRALAELKALADRPVPTQRTNCLPSPARSCA